MIDWSKIKASDINAKNVKSFIEGNLNDLTDKYGELNPLIKSNAIYRASQCVECYKKGSCIECGCDFNAMSKSPSKSCPKGKWNSYEIGTNVNITKYVDVSINDTTHKIRACSTCKVSNKFVIRNNTDEILKIKDINVSCNCTVVEGYNEVIGVDEDIVINYTIDMNKISDNKTTKFIEIKFDNNVIMLPLLINITKI